MENNNIIFSSKISKSGDVFLIRIPKILKEVVRNKHRKALKVTLDFY